MRKKDLRLRDVRFYSAVQRRAPRSPPWAPIGGRRARPLRDHRLHWNLNVAASASTPNYRPAVHLRATLQLFSHSSTAKVPELRLSATPARLVFAIVGPQLRRDRR